MAGRLNAEQKLLYKRTVFQPSFPPPISSVSPHRLQLAVSTLERPDVWRSEDFAVQEAVVPTGHAPLDAQLPGGGWPVGSLVEILQAQPGRHAWQLLLPALSQR